MAGKKTYSRKAKRWMQDGKFTSPPPGYTAKGTKKSGSKPRAKAKSKAPAKRKSYRRNPAKGPEVIGMLTEGTKAAGQILLGKAVARSGWIW